MKFFNEVQMSRYWIFLLLVLATSCKQNAPEEQSAAVTVKAVTIERKDTPVVFEYIGQTKSSRMVEIRARVDGFLDEVAYTEGAHVDAGQILFELDKKPFEANLQQAKGELALQKARLTTASSNLDRIAPLAVKDAVSQKDLDDAVGAKKASQASVLVALGALRQAQLNLDYTTIRSPLKGLASKTLRQEGSYIPTGEGSLLTYVAQLDPIWVVFSISENQLFNLRNQETKGLLIPPAKGEYEVEIKYADGSIHPYKGHINFQEPTIDPQTGTRLIRAELKNDGGLIYPGQFVRVYLHGAIRPNSIVIPQIAVIEGAKGHFVWVIGKDNKPEVRLVELGPWQGSGIFVDNGLNPGDVVITEGVMKLNSETPVKVVE